VCRERACFVRHFVGAGGARVRGASHHKVHGAGRQKPRVFARAVFSFFPMYQLSEFYIQCNIKFDFYLNKLLKQCVLDFRMAPFGE
jgi:hypothetical protein